MWLYLGMVLEFLRRYVKPLVVKYWWIAPILALLAFGYVQSKKLDAERAKVVKVEKTLKTERGEWDTERKRAKAVAIGIQAEYQTNLDKAKAAYKADMASFVPLVITRDKIVKEYAKTDAGQSVCLDPVGMRYFQEARERLISYHPASAPQPASGGAGAVYASTTAKGH